MEVVDLLKETIITKDEAREILFTQEDEKTADKKDLQSEIKFLRELVEKLSTQSQIKTIIWDILPGYSKWPWYQPYYGWCIAGMQSSGTSGDITTAIGGTAGMQYAGVGNAIYSINNASTSLGGVSLTYSTNANGDIDFKDIKTF